MKSESQEIWIHHWLHTLDMFGHTGSGFR